MTPSETRTSDGRFAPGRSGNPAGRPKGSRNRVSALAEILEEGDEDRMLRLMAGKALEGNVACLKYCLDRLQPRRRAIRLELPDGVEHNGAAYHAAVLRAAAEGEITPEEAASLARLVAARQPVMKAHLVERRLAAADRPAADDAEAYVPSEFLFPCLWEEGEEEASSPSPLVGPSTRAQEGRGGGLRADEMPGGIVPACTPHPDLPPQGGKEKDVPTDAEAASLASSSPLAGQGYRI
jgi:hypothetical protein